MARSRKEKAKAVSSALKACEKEIARVEAINRSVKDREVDGQIKLARGKLTQMDKTLGSWITGRAGGLVAHTLFLGGIALVSKVLSSIIKRLSRRQQETLNELREQHAQARFERYRQNQNPPRPPQNPQRPPQLIDIPLDRRTQEAINNLNRLRAEQEEERRLRNINYSVTTIPAPGLAETFPELVGNREQLRNRAQAEMRATQERLRREMAERQAQRAHAENAVHAISEAANRIRELDFNEGQGGPVNSPGDQGARFSGLDMDSGYLVVGRKRYRNSIITHDSMPWSRCTRYNDFDLIQTVKNVAEKLRKQLVAIKKYAWAHPHISRLISLVMGIIGTLFSLSGVSSLADGSYEIYSKRLAKKRREAATLIDDIERNDEIIAAHDSNLKITLKLLKGTLKMVGAISASILSNAYNPDAR